MTTCEYCGKTLRPGDTVHGIKYGTLAGSGFVPAKDAAVTVICGPCGNRLCNFIYASLDQNKRTYPALFNTYEQLATVMKNGYRVIQAMSKLPASDQSAIQLLITISKDVR